MRSVPRRPRQRPALVRGDSRAWASGLSSIFVELEVELLEDRALIGRLYPQPFGDMTFVRAIASGCEHRVTRSLALIEKSAHRNFFICLLLNGSARLEQGGRSALLEPGDLAILDSTRVYSMEIPESFDALWINVPRYRLEGRLPRLGQIMAQKLDGHSGIGYVVSAMLRAALEETSTIDAASANRVANSMFDLLSATLALADDTVRPESSYRSSVLRRVREYIEAGLDEGDLRAATIARAHGVSVRYLSKLFERDGISLARWVRMRRLERCRADLEDPRCLDRRIADIAFDHGFGNICHFNRLFRSRFGSTPSAFRLQPPSYQNVRADSAASAKLGKHASRAPVATS